MFSGSSMRERIRRAVERGLGIEIDAREFAASGRLDDFLGMDSIAAMEIVVALEKEFGIIFEAGMLTGEKISDLQVLESYLEERT